MENGREIKEQKRMALNYLKSDFTVDVLSTIPFDLFASLGSSENDGYKVLGALKLTRILRLNKLITFMRSNEQVKATLKLIKLVFFLVMYLHVFGCLWWLIVAQ
jgi:heme/copper-type cytochrome/quinol oxidase subunit 4